MPKLTLLFPLLALALTPGSPLIAATFPVDREAVDAQVSTDLGQLLDWSQTDRRIERIFIDNPEQFRAAFVFTTDGCDKDKCSATASMVNISARAETEGIRRGSMKVILKNRMGKKSVCVIRLTKVTWAIRDGVTSFIPVAARLNSQQ
jgi:hypothetical protein